MRTRFLVAAIAATASLAACGGEDPSPTSGTPTREAANRKAMLDLARCMRSNGIDMPDPKFEGGRVTQRMGGPGKVDPDVMRKAEKACAKYREAIKAPEMSDEDKEKFRKAALEHSRCMREHGIKMPDPQFDENGGAQIRIGRGSGIDINDPKFRAAQKACEDKMPGFGSTDSEEDQ